MFHNYGVSFSDWSTLTWDERIERVQVVEGILNSQALSPYWVYIGSDTLMVQRVGKRIEPEALERRIAPYFEELNVSVSEG